MSTVSARPNTETPSGKPWRQSADRERIRAYVQEHPTATVRQIARHCGINSTSHVHRMLKQVRADLCVCPTCGGKGSIRTSAPDAAGASQRDPGPISSVVKAAGA